MANSLITYTGVDVKLLQYNDTQNIQDIEKIDLPDILNKATHTHGENQIMLINLEKDLFRYNSALKEFKKVNIRNFCHLKGTYWKNKKQLEDDLKYVLTFLSQFTKIENIQDLKCDDFSNFNDTNIKIQCGPLACYVSHLRAMIYAYQNSADYFAVIEDDINIINTVDIQKYLSNMPSDWDIVTLNSITKKVPQPTEVFYKVDHDFHSTHFYIMRKKCMEKLFCHMYPITDQVDVLISEMKNELNIYNIAGTVYQKSLSTNTQNNLHVIFTSPNYEVIRTRFRSFEENLILLLDTVFGQHERNKNIASYLIYDNIFTFIRRTEEEDKQLLEKTQAEKREEDISENMREEIMPFLDKMTQDLCFIISCCKKGISCGARAQSIVKYIYQTILLFENKNTEDTINYAYGSSAYTYKKENTIVKKYMKNLRWTMIDEHENPQNIFIKETEILERLGLLISKTENSFTMPYLGCTLFEYFELPTDWKTQIIEIFKIFSEKNIEYREFSLNNILYNRETGKLSIIDFGLANITENAYAKNKYHYRNFIDILEKLEVKMSINYLNNIYYLEFINNVCEIYPNNLF